MIMKYQHFPCAFRSFFIAFRSYSTRELPYHDLATFVSYSNAGLMDQTTYTYQGTLYEYCVSNLLQKTWNLTVLNHVGGRGDHGIDIQGYWQMTRSKDARLGLIIQCKSNTKNGASAKIVRELIGSTATENEKRPFNTIGVLASASELSKQSFNTLMQSHIPLIYLRINKMIPFYDKGEQTHVFPTIQDGSAIKKTIMNEPAKKLLSRENILEGNSDRMLELS